MRPTQYVMSAAVVAVMVGLGVGLGTGDVEHPAEAPVPVVQEVKAVNVVPVEDLRIAVKKGTCPTKDEKCPGGMIQHGPKCLCYTDDPETLAGELTELSAQAGDLQKLIVCHEQVEEQWVFLTRYVVQEATIPKECELVAEKLPHTTSTGIPGTLEAQLANTCKPCVIGPKDWGSCPYCVHPDYPVSCAEACEIQEVVNP